MEGGVMGGQDWQGRMLKWLFTAILAGFLSGCATMHEAESPRHLHHLVIIWLKQPGDETLRQQYITESKPLAKLPGVLAYDVGTPAAIKRRHTSSALDESYDVAISSEYEDQQAYEAFLKNPEYQRVAQDVLRPLVDRYKVYDFIE